MQLAIGCHNVVTGEGVHFTGEHRVLEAVLVGGRVFVIYDWMAFRLDRPAQNLFCYSPQGDFLWRAAEAVGGPTDAYTGFLRESPLWVLNFDGFDVRVDEASGRVLDRRFTK